MRSRTIWGLLVFLPAFQLAQEIPSIRVSVDLVNILCSVRDRNGLLVNTLTRDDFIVLEDGAPQTIRNFARETDLPLTIGLLVDTSNSQIHLIKDEHRAATQFLSRVIHKTDRAFLFRFDARTDLLMDFTSSSRGIHAGLDKLNLIAPHPGDRQSHPRGTVLYDAVTLAAGKLRAEPGRKAIVLITDGADVGSRLELRDAIDAAQKSDVILYSIYYADTKGVQDSNRPGEFALKEMSEETGGHVFKVDRKHPLNKIFDRIQQEMRSQYALGYTAADKTRTGFRRLSVMTRDRNLTVQARKGFYLPGDAP